MHKGIKDIHEHLALTAQDGHRRLADASKRALHAADPHRINNVRREAKGNHLRHRKGESFVKEAIEVNVHALPVLRINENVLAVPIAECGALWSILSLVSAIWGR